MFSLVEVIRFICCEDFFVLTANNLSEDNDRLIFHPMIK